MKIEAENIELSKVCKNGQCFQLHNILKPFPNDYYTVPTGSR